MIRVITVLVLLATATLAWADCGVNTIVTTDGRIISCTVCCLGGSCSTTCSR
jgi:hypothetical protein